MNNNDFELENMREQMAALKKKLDKQEIVNDHIIRQSMTKAAGSINRTYFWVIILGILMIPYGYWVFVMLAGFSIAFWIGTSIFMLVCAGATYYNKRNLNDANLMSNNLVETRRRIARAKKFDNDWLLFGIPALLVWLAWFFYEIYKLNHDLFYQPMFWGGCVGGVIGAVIGLSIHFKNQRQYKEIIDQIDDMTENELTE
ncbi:MAG: hypothetical protein IKX36_07760 [Prevotella sp.]|nr:hypothetical protein [Prevotella sp.]